MTDDAESTSGDPEPLRIDVDRLGMQPVGLPVRAWHPGFVFDGSDQGWRRTDIAHLDAPSLLRWLRAKDGNNPRAEDVVGVLLEHHGQLSCITGQIQNGKLTITSSETVTDTGEALDLHVAARDHDPSTDESGDA